MPSIGWADRLRRSPPWDAPLYWALDLEASGLRPKEDQILSVGTVPIRQGTIRWGERFYSLVRPEDPASLSPDGIRAHHILPSELANAPPIRDVLGEVDRRIREGVLVLHHAPLDLGLLREAYRRFGMTWPRPKVVDTIDLIVKWQHRRQRFEPHAKTYRTGLASARDEMGLPPFVNHHALNDALATAELFLLLRSRLGARTLRQLL
jgi:DNA polymerase-3 subunit epsilon